jgi:hypothetical protein
VMLPLQGLSNKHLLLKGDEVAPSARAEVVVASRGVYIEFNLYFATSVTIRELKLRLSTRAL